MNNQGQPPDPGREQRLAALARAREARAQNVAAQQAQQPPVEPAVVEPVQPAEQPPVQPAEQPPVEPAVQPAEQPPVEPEKPKAPVVRSVNFSVFIKAIENEDVAKLTEYLKQSSKPVTKIVLPTKDVGTPEDLTTAKNVTPLMMAVVKGNLEMTKIILDALKNEYALGRVNHINSLGHSALRMAYELPNKDIFNLLIENGANPLMLEYEYVVPEEGAQPIKVPRRVVFMMFEDPGNLALLQKHVIDSRYLSEPRFVFRMLYKCIEADHADKYEYIKLILDNVSKSGQLSNVLKLTTKIVTEILAEENDDSTLFMEIALQPDCLELFKLVYNSWPYLSVNYKDKHGLNLFHYLAKNKNHQAAVALYDYLKEIKRFAPNIKDNKGNYPLNYAIRAQNKEMVNRLIKEFPKEQTNIVNDEGETILFDAVRYAIPDIVKYLIEKGANTELKNKENKYARDYIPDISEYTDVSKTKQLLSLTSKPKYGMPAENILDNIKYSFFYSRDLSFCPVCLIPVVTDTGCLYVQDHNCTAISGNIWHKDLYDKYNVYGTIEWCKNCGDITGNHGHYEYRDPSEPKGKIKPKVNNLNDFFQNQSDNSDSKCKMNSGLGYLQKYNRMFTLYNELCKVSSELRNGKFLPLQTTKDKLVEAAWRATKPADSDPNVPNTNILPKANEIMDDLHKQFDNVYKQYLKDLKDKKISSDSTFQSIFSTEEGVKRVDEAFKKYGQPFCDMTSETSAQEEPVDKEIAARIEAELQKRNAFLKVFNEKLANIELPLYERTPEEQDKPGDNGETEKVEPVSDNNCTENFGPHTDGRKIYGFTHVQRGTNKHISHTEGLSCPADFREAIESIYLTIPEDRLINKDQDPVIGVHCIFDKSCTGDLYPDQINQIPSEDFYLPTMMNPEELDLETRKEKGEQFKKWYNNMFIRNRVMIDYDDYVNTKTIMMGGGPQELNNISQLFGPTQIADTECTFPQKSKGGHTYRKKNIRYKIYCR